MAATDTLPPRLSRRDDPHLVGDLKHFAEILAVLHSPPVVLAAMLRAAVAFAEHHDIAAGSTAQPLAEMADSVLEVADLRSAAAG